MLGNGLWCDLRALNKIPLVPVSTLLITGTCLNFLGGDSVRTTSLCCGLVAGFACAFMNRGAKLTRRCFWVLLVLVAVVMVAYNLLCFGSSHWEQSSWLCVAVFMLTSIVRTDHGLPLSADRAVVIREAEDEGDDYQFEEESDE
jgi:peptidoglycan/LPS O-acetylase OafA/YrhL